MRLPTFTPTNPPSLPLSPPSLPPSPPRSAYNIIESICDVFGPGEKMELRDAIANIHPTNPPFFPPSLPSLPPSLPPP